MKDWALLIPICVHSVDVSDLHKSNLCHNRGSWTALNHNRCQCDGSCDAECQMGDFDQSRQSLKGWCVAIDWTGFLFWCHSVGIMRSNLSLHGKESSTTCSPFHRNPDHLTLWRTSSWPPLWVTASLNFSGKESFTSGSTALIHPSDDPICPQILGHQASEDSSCHWLWFMPFSVM